MAVTPTSRPILHAIAPRFAVGNAEQTLVFYERIGFACTHQEDGFMIVERDGVQLHLHPSNEPPTRHGFLKRAGGDLAEGEEERRLAA